MSGSGWSAHFYTGHHTGKIKAAEKKNSTSFPMWNFFVPLRGLYFDFNIKANQHQFPPPYGNHTGDDAIVMGATIYPPPYGDYIPAMINNIDTNSFSPPYGDYILNISQPIEKRKSQKVGKCSLYCNAVNLHKKEQMQTLRL